MKNSNKTNILNNVKMLVDAYEQGKLGEDKMPEDENPNLTSKSKENYLYFTLPMALNYQRNSYTLWKNCHQMFKDKDTVDCFSPKQVCKMNVEELKTKLTKYSVALQKNKQTQIWHTLCATFSEKFDGDVRNMFQTHNQSVKEIKTYMLANKKDFPYLSGNKIMNYWLYVMEQYTDLKFTDREYITIAPDTHVLQASLKLGIINEEEFTSTNIQTIVSKRWENILKKSDYTPIDIHTPLWLWSRSKFEFVLK